MNSLLPAHRYIAVGILVRVDWAMMLVARWPVQVGGWECSEE
jgi:hypothetical protein